MDRYAARAEELVHRRLHVELSLGKVAVDVVVSGEDSPRPDLAEPRLEVLLHGSVIVARVDVDEVEISVWDLRRCLDRGHPPDRAARTVTGEALTGLLVVPLELVLRHVRAVDVLGSVGGEPGIDRDQLPSVPVPQQEIGVETPLHADLGAPSVKAA
jgi:hypothetical protein